MASTFRTRLHSGFVLLLVIAGSLVTPATVSAQAAGDWPRFRGGPAQVGVNPDLCPAADVVEDHQQPPARGLGAEAGAGFQLVGELLS